MARDFIINQKALRDLLSVWADMFFRAIMSYLYPKFAKSVFLLRFKCAIRLLGQSADPTFLVEPTVKKFARP